MFFKELFFAEEERFELSRAYSWPIYYTRQVPCYAYHYITSSMFLSTWLDSNQRNGVLQTPALDHSTTGAFLLVWTGFEPVFLSVPLIVY